MSNQFNYLDKEGVRQLWAAVKTHDENVLTSVEDKIKDISLTYDQDAKKIFLTGTGAESPVSIDVNDFVKDGVLDTVNVVEATPESPIESLTDGTKFLRFEWNADAGKTVTYLKVSDFAKVYEGSDSIGINDSNMLYVKEVSTTATKTSEVIPVAGGPLAELLNSKGIYSIDANTDMQALLFQLFCEVLWPGKDGKNGTTNTNGSVKVSLADPTFTLTDNSGASVVGGVVEVGTVCNLSEVTMSAAQPAVNVYPKVSGFTYGYSAADDNTVDSTDTVITGTLVDGTDVDLTSDNYSMTLDYTNFVYAAGSSVGTAGASAADVTVTPDADYTKVKYNGDKLAVVNGENKIVVSLGGPKAVASFAAIEPHYACTNTGKTNDGTNPYHISTKLEQANDVKSSSASKSKTVTVTGKYKYFVGYYSDEVFDNKEYTSTSIRTTDVSKSGFVNGTTVTAFDVTVPTGTKGMYIAIPEGIDDTGATLDVKQKTNSNNPVNAEMVKNLRTVSNMACAGTATKNYKVFTWSFPGGTAGEEIFTISKF